MPESPEGDAGPIVDDQRLFQPWDYAVFLVLTALNTLVIVRFGMHWTGLEDWDTIPVFTALITLLVVYWLVVYQLRWFSLLIMRRPAPVSPEEGLTVGVVTTFVPGAEPIAMLERTVRALVAMDYPHDTWVLDEGDDEEVRALCARLGAHHFSRKNRPEYQTPSGTFQSRSKHGNYNAWFHEIGFERYEILVGFDPDHVPAPNFLTRVLGYFKDPEVGYVQAAQAYYNQAASFIAQGAAEETYQYYSVTQMAMHALGFPIVTGCHQAHRTTALEEVGGFAAHDADDLLITFLYRGAGWRGVYVPEILARGLTPVDWTGYLNQQRRWARSVLDVKLRAYPRLAGGLALKDRLLGLLHGIYYLQGLITAAGVALLAALLFIEAAPQFLSKATVLQALVLFGVLQVSEFYKQRFYLGGRSEWGVHWRAGLLQMVKWPSLALALLDVLLDRRPAYAMTPKVRSRARHFLLVRHHGVAVLVVLVAWIAAIVSGRDLRLILHFWAAVMVLVPLGVVWTESWSFPPPYEDELWDPGPDFGG